MNTIKNNRSNEERLRLRDKVIAKHNGNIMTEKMMHMLYVRNVRV